MRSFLLIFMLLLLRFEEADSWLENCPCSSIASSPSACPFNRECDNERVKDYRTGIPWRYTDAIGCSEGRHQPSTGSALAASVAVVACAASSKCTNCAPLTSDPYCHPDYVCRSDALTMTQTDDGCNIASCTWGELMTIDTVISVGSPTLPHASSIPIQQPTESQGAKPSEAVIKPFPPEPILGLTSNRGFMEHPSAGLGAMSGSGASCNGGSIRDPTPGLRTLSGSGASRNPVTGLGPIPGSGTNSAANPMTGPKSGSGALEMIPKREEEYYDDSLLEKSSERPTIASKMTMTTSTTTVSTTRAATTAASRTTTTAAETSAATAGTTTKDVATSVITDAPITTAAATPTA
ncbi:hypothetical protein PENTCL1PPCAC_20162, partial [Pristionchus entomophagus]